MDAFSLPLSGLITGPAQGVLLVVVHLVLVKESAATITVGIVGIVAIVAQRDAVGSTVGSLPDPLAAVMAEQGQFLQAIWAKELVLKVEAILCRQEFSAVGANFFLIHLVPPKRKEPVPGKSLGLALCGVLGSRPDGKGHGELQAFLGDGQGKRALHRWDHLRKRIVQ